MFNKLAQMCVRSRLKKLKVLKGVAYSYIFFTIILKSVIDLNF